MDNKEFGRIGEDIAADYLKKRGFKILKRNFRTRFGEIDIIAETDSHIHFIEVKTRKNNDFGTPFESVTLAKQRQIINIARYFLMKLKKEPFCHFSVIGIVMDNFGNQDVKFLEDAFHLS